MKIKFIKEYQAIKEDDICNIYGVGMVWDDVPATSAQWLIDNGFAEEVKEYGWKPKYNEEYFYVGHDGSVHPCMWENSPLDNGRLKLGFVFKTEETAERYRSYLEAVAAVRHDEGVLTPEKVRETLNQYGTVYTVGTNATALSVEHFYNASAGAVYFDTLYNANTSIGNHPDEWEIITNYDWSRE